MKLSLTIQTPDVEKIVPVALLEGTFEEKLQKAAEFGADGVELVTTHPEMVKGEKLLPRLEKRGLQIAAVASGGMASAGWTLMNPDAGVAAEAARKLEGLIRMAGAMGAPVVTVGSFRGRTGGDPGARQRLVKALSSAGKLAEPLGVRLAVEPLNRYETDLLHNVDEMLSFIEEVDQPAVGMLFDTFHANIEEASRTEPIRRAAAAGKLFHVHVADNNRLAPGWGLIDFGEIVGTLQEVGYEGWLSAELFPLPDADAAGKQTIAHLRPIIQKALTAKGAKNAKDIK